MAETIVQIYDKVFKKILTLSSRAVVNLINGLFGTDYPPDSTVDYQWTESVAEEGGGLRRTLADTIIRINHSDSYHIEAQMTRDDDIIFRVFQYGYEYAGKNRATDEAGAVLYFPEPKIIYLCPMKEELNEYTLTLDFGRQGTFSYRAPVFRFQEVSVEELNQRKMVILIPFLLLKLKKVMEKERTPENLEALKNLIQNGIIANIDENVRVGNITVDDAQRLRRLTHRLYRHIYSHYDEMEALNEMTDESLILDIDIIDMEHEKEVQRIVAEKDCIIAEKDNAIAERDNVIAEKDNAIAEKDNAIAEKNHVIAEQERELMLIRKQLRELQK